MSMFSSSFIFSMSRSSSASMSIADDGGFGGGCCVNDGGGFSVGFDLDVSGGCVPEVGSDVPKSNRSSEAAF